MLFSYGQRINQKRPSGNIFRNSRFSLMGRIHIFGFIVVQSVLMAAVIGLLLHLLRIVAVYRRVLQILNDVLEVFIAGELLGFRHGKLSSLS